MRTREAMMGVMMGAKYSAEWWEKIAGLNREISAREDPSSVTDDLIQATAGARRSPARTSETPPLEAAPGGDLRKIKTDRFFLSLERVRVKWNQHERRTGSAPSPIGRGVG
jgi:hypothetical protein